MNDEEKEKEWIAKAKRQEKADAKDISKYRLPARTKDIEIPTDEGWTFRFKLTRPTQKAKIDLMEKYHLFDDAKKALNDPKEILEYTYDSVTLMVSKASIEEGEKEQMLPIPLSRKFLEDMDGALLELLNMECQLMIKMSERDRYFRATGRIEELETPKDVDVQSLRIPGKTPP